MMVKTPKPYVEALHDLARHLASVDRRGPIPPALTVPVREAGELEKVEVMALEECLHLGTSQGTGLA